MRDLHAERRRQPNDIGGRERRTSGRRFPCGRPAEAEAEAGGGGGAGRVERSARSQRSAAFAGRGGGRVAQWPLLRQPLGAESREEPCGRSGGGGRSPSAAALARRRPRVGQSLQSIHLRKVSAASELVVRQLALGRAESSAGELATHREYCALFSSRSLARSKGAFQAARPLSRLQRSLQWRA